MTKAPASVREENVVARELGEEELEQVGGGVTYSSGGESCIKATAGALGGWGAFQYCTAKFFGLVD